MPPRKKPTAPPAKDEWGLYDPEEAGLPAVLGRFEAKRRASAATYAARVARTLRAARRTAPPEDRDPPE
jgi:hypothetical protein